MAVLVSGGTANPSRSFTARFVAIDTVGPGNRLDTIWVVTTPSSPRLTTFNAYSLRRTIVRALPVSGENVAFRKRPRPESLDTRR